MTSRWPFKCSKIPSYAHAQHVVNGPKALEGALDNFALLTNTAAPL